MIENEICPVKHYMDARNNKIAEMIQELQTETTQQISELVSQEGMESFIIAPSELGLGGDDGVGMMLSKGLMSWQENDFRRSCLIHPRIVNWRCEYFRDYGIHLSTDYAQNMARYEFMLHLNLYPSFEEIRAPAIGVLLLGQMPMLQQLEYSFMYIGLFMKRDDHLNKRLKKYEDIIRFKIETFKGFLIRFYENLASQIRMSYRNDQSCFRRFFSCFYPAGALEQQLLELTNKHYQRLKPDDMLNEIGSLNALTIAMFEAGALQTSTYGAVGHSIELRDMSSGGTMAHEESQPLITSIA